MTCSAQSTLKPQASVPLPNIPGLTPAGNQAFKIWAQSVLAQIQGAAGATGVNVIPQQYALLAGSTLPPIASSSNCTVTADTGTPLFGAGGSYKIAITGSPATVTFSVDTAWPLHPGWSWIVSFFQQASAAIAGVLTITTPAKSYTTDFTTTLSASGFQRLYDTLNLIADTSTSFGVSFTFTGGVGKTVWLDGLMMEPYFGTAMQPSPFISTSSALTQDNVPQGASQFWVSLIDGSNRALIDFKQSGHISKPHGFAGLGQIPTTSSVKLGTSSFVAMGNLVQLPGIVSYSVNVNFGGIVDLLFTNATGSTANGYGMRVDCRSGESIGQILKRTSGVWSLIGTVGALNGSTLSGYFNVNAVFYPGNYMEMYVDGALVAYATDASFTPTGAMYAISEVVTGSYILPMSAQSIGAPWAATIGGHAYVGVGSVSKNSGAAATWDSAAYTTQCFSTCCIQGKANSASLHQMIGLALDPNASNSLSFVNLAYAWYLDSTATWRIYEAGTPVTSFAGGSANDMAAITYDGSTVTYWLNSVSKRTVSVAGQIFYGGITLYDIGSGFNSVRFLPSAVYETIGMDSQAVDGLTFIRMTAPPAVSAAASTSLSQSGTTTTINVGASTFYVGNITLNANSGSVTPPGYGKYYIYFDAPTYTSGAQTYQATTDATVITQNPFRFYVGTITTASGGGGTGGGGGISGTGCCLHESQLIELADGREIPARDLTTEMTLLSHEGPTPVTQLRFLPHREWYRVRLGNGVELFVAGDHRFIDPDGEQLRTWDLRPKQMVRASDGYTFVTALEVLWEDAIKVAIEVGEPHTYYVQGILSHNKNLC